MFEPRYLYCGIGSVPEVTLPLASLGLGIEVVFDDTTDLWPDLRWENLLAVIDEVRAARIEAAVHGPFHGVNLGSRDPNQRMISYTLLTNALEFAQAVRSPHMVIHSGFVPQYSPKARVKWTNEFCAMIEPLLVRAGEMGVRVLLENTYEPDTSLFEEIFERVTNPMLGMCLDTGHASCFGRVEPVTWSRRFAERISHLHCSDNDGRDDLHWLPGRGVVQFQELLQPLRGIGAYATVTYEVALDDAAAAHEYVDRIVQSL